MDNKSIHQAVDNFIASHNLSTVKENDVDNHIVLPAGFYFSLIPGYLFEPVCYRSPFT